MDAYLLFYLLIGFILFLSRKFYHPLTKVVFVAYYSFITTYFFWAKDRWGEYYDIQEFYSHYSMLENLMALPLILLCLYLAIWKIFNKTTEEHIRLISVLIIFYLIAVIPPSIIYFDLQYAFGP